MTERKEEREREIYMLNCVDEVLSALKQRLFFRKVKVGGKVATRKQVVSHTDGHQLSKPLPGEKSKNPLCLVLVQISRSHFWKGRTRYLQQQTSDLAQT